MEKIQSAIAKARAARTDQDVAGPPSQAQATTAPVAPAAAAAAAVTEAWKKLATFAPPAKLLKRHRIVTAAETAEGMAQFDKLRTRVMQEMRANGWRRLAITSPTSACGKSTVVLNLAFSLARQTDLRFVVNEIDMRRPSLARTLGLSGSRSFASVLQGDADFADQAIRPRPNVALGLNQTPIRNSAELLQRPSVGIALAEIEAKFDPTLTLFDLPPMLTNDDAMAFIGQVDCALLVVAAGSCTLREIDTCERELATQTNVLGIVLNKCRYMDRDAGHDY
ncbi:CpsD/CapB family tyrosine-protein kinase [Loktanella sp. DJP18]|uniref:CpsD/CapB family tyrosine-protein kinase n=1 Tax=Loktanella sp. DJP18 TaxID=3409788 RepID=UPI003BB7F12D